MRIHGRSSHYALLGTYGGTIVNWDIAENKGKTAIIRKTLTFYLIITASGKFTGHLQEVSAIVNERAANMNTMLSGAYDTNVKIWDVRQR